jgi:predicted MPP superfamily phosphohydrolase
LTTILKFAGFITAILVLWFGTHYLLYASFVRFFVITDPGTRKTILMVLVFLALSFFISAFLLHLHVINPFTEVLYFIAAVWLGLFLYSLMALILIWLFFGAVKLVGLVPDMRLVAAGFFILAVAVSGYGLWSAQNPRLKHIEVKIEGLPEQWRDKKIIQLSDVHLGAIYGTGFMQRVADKVNGENPDLILITGDLFDGMGGRLTSFVESLNSLKASRGVFFVTGNHEGYLGLKEPFAVLGKTHIRVLDNEIVDIDGLEIVGIRYPEHDRINNTRRLMTQSGSYDAGKPSILMYHTPTNIDETYPDRASQQSRTYWHPDTSMALAKEVGIDLQLSGHTHKGQLFPFMFQTRSAYKGFDYGLHREGGFQVYITSGVGTWGPPMRVGVPPEIVSILLR